MALLTLLARASDGLPLSASIQDENQVLYNFPYTMKSLHFLFLSVGQGPQRFSTKGKENFQKTDLPVPSKMQHK